MRCTSAIRRTDSRTHGQAFRDVVWGVARTASTHMPDLVVRPTSDAEVVDVLDWCSDARIAVIPFGGGSSVVGGVEPRLRRYPRPSASTSADGPGAGDRPRQPRGADPGRRARSPPGGPAPPAAASRCGSSRSRSSSPRSAAGSRPGPVATSPRCSPTSTTSPSRCASSPPPASSSPGASGFRRRAVAGPDVPRLRGDARRDHRGVDAPAGPPALARPRPPCTSRTTSGRRTPRARIASRDSTRRTAGCSIPPRHSSTRASTSGGVLVLAFESADHRRARGCIEPWRSFREHEGTLPDPSAPATRPTGRGADEARRPGDRRSSACHTSATSSPSTA